MRRLGLLAAFIVGSLGTAAADERTLYSLVAPHSRGEAAIESQRLVEETAGSRKYDLALLAGDGRTWRYFVREPLQRSAPFAAVLVLAGIETGRESLGFIAERSDMVLLGMDYPYRGPERLEGWELLGALPALRRMAFETVEAAALGITYLSQRADVDPTRIVVLGVSLGSIFAVALGAHDARADVVVAIYGGGDLAVLARRNLPGKPWWIPSFVVGPIVRAYFGELEPLSHVARIAPRYLLMVSSAKDEMFPPDSARRLFERAGEPKKLVWYETGHMDLFDPGLLRRLTSDVVAELEAGGYLGSERSTAR